MEQQIYDVIDQLLRFRVVEILIALSAVLILIDYFFPTDVPAHLGDFCFAVAIFLVATLKPFPLRDCLMMALVVWISLAVLHQSWFRRYLENAPGTAGYQVEE